MTFGAHIAVHTTAAQRKKLQQEEEEMTKYTRQELKEDWEFKFVRSATGEFKKPEVFHRVIEEEALAGWIMVEKFDKNRIRFKRPQSAKKRDMMLPEGFDPYRTEYGISEGALAVRILGVVFGITLLIILIIILVESGTLSF